MQGLLNVQFWLWGQDALRADFEARGFVKQPNPTERGSSLYRRGDLTLHSSGLWLEIGGEVLAYSRPKDKFFVLTGPQAAPVLPPGALEQAYAEGFTRLEGHLLEHERWIMGRYGLQDRFRLLEKLPPNARKSRAVWQGWFDYRLATLSPKKPTMPSAIPVANF